MNISTDDQGYFRVTMSEEESRVMIEEAMLKAVHGHVVDGRTIDKKDCKVVDAVNDFCTFIIKVQNSGLDEDGDGLINENNYAI